MRTRCIIVFYVLGMFAGYEGFAENTIQIENASEILFEHFLGPFDIQSIDIDSQKPQDENIDIRLMDVDRKDEVTIRYKGNNLKSGDNCVFPSLIENGILAVSYAGRGHEKCYASLELYIPKKELRHRYHMEQLLSILRGDTASIKKTPDNDSDSEDLGAALQKTLTAFQNVHANLEFPEHLIAKDAKKQGDEFDVEKYFTVLKHLSMKDGYRLDYVYPMGGIGRSPVLYSRKADQPAYTDYEEYVNAVRKKAHVDEIESIEKEYRKKIDAMGITAAGEWREKQLEKYPDYQHWQWYLDDICVDGTAQGWLELIILDLLGDQFYQFWHAAYNDTMIIPANTAVSAVSNLHIVDEETVPPVIALLGSALDVRPLVEVKDETVTVSIVTFSKWGGFSEQVFSINKNQPHRIKEISDNTLILYHCNVIF